MFAYVGSIQNSEDLTDGVVYYKEKTLISGTETARFDEKRIQIEKTGGLKVVN